MMTSPTPRPTSLARPAFKQAQRASDNGPRYDGNHGMPTFERQGDGDDIRPPRSERDLSRLGQGHLDQHSFSMKGNRSDPSMPPEIQGSSNAWLCKVRCSVGTRGSNWRVRAMARNFNNLRSDGR
jgi:hypothetical protein